MECGSWEQPTWKMYLTKLIGSVTSSCSVGSTFCLPEWPWLARKYKRFPVESRQYWNRCLLLPRAKRSIQSSVLQLLLSTVGSTWLYSRRNLSHATAPSTSWSWSLWSRIRHMVLDNQQTLLSSFQSPRLATGTVIQCLCSNGIVAFIDDDEAWCCAGVEFVAFVPTSSFPSGISVSYSSLGWSQPRIETHHFA